MPRWIQTLLITLLGLAAGLFYGWKIAPVEYIDASPSSLSLEYRAEYVLMVAEAYQIENSVSLAVERLTVLDGAPPLKIVGNYLNEWDYTQSETELLKKLEKAIETSLPTQSEAAP